MFKCFYTQFQVSLSVLGGPYFFAKGTVIRYIGPRLNSVCSILRGFGLYSSVLVGSIRCSYYIRFKSMKIVISVDMKGYSPFCSVLQREQFHNRNPKSRYPPESINPMHPSRGGSKIFWRAVWILKCRPKNCVFLAPTPSKIVYIGAKGAFGKILELLEHKLIS